MVGSRTLCWYKVFPLEPEERKRLGTDPMFKLQYQGKDEAVVEEAEPMMDKLQVWNLEQSFILCNLIFVEI